MDTADRTDSAKDIADVKKNKNVKLIMRIGIAAIIIITAIVLVNYFVSPSAVARSMFYKDFPGATIISVNDEEMKSDSGLHRVIMIAFNYSGKVIFAHGHDYDLVAYDFEYIDNQWVFIAKIME